MHSFREREGKREGVRKREERQKDKQTEIRKKNHSHGSP